MRQLPSGTRLSPPWPIAAFNSLGPLLRSLGLFPKLDDPDAFKAVERDVGRKDGASPWVRTARRVRLKSYEEDADLTLFGTLAVRSQVLQCFRHTLEFDRFIEERPQIEEEQITRPLFVMGWPRTGTTLTQRLLSLHKDARFTPVWEGYCPLPERRGRRLSEAARIKKSRRALGLLKWVAPDLNIIHPMSFDDPDECYHLFRNYAAMPPGWDFAYLPGYWDWFAGQSAVPAYQMHKRQLQILQWLNRGGHWVLKSPQHMAGLPALLEVYPDARLVMTHRDPVECVASYCSLVAVAWGMTSDRFDKRKITDYVLSSAALAQKVSREALRRVPADRVVHVDYEQITTAPVATITGIYSKMGYQRDPALPAKIEAWLAANPKGRHGRHTYSLADFDLTERDVREALCDPEPAGNQRKAGCV
ncbi:MAG TPA: sulfotransferase [Hyphomicrobium sp.]|nr:sulfotransferase [Hyphomicrobium sp.]